MLIVRFSKFYLVLISVFMIAFSACKKKKEISYSFSYTGSPYVGHTVHFTNTSSGINGFFWNFQDGTTASVAKPDHIFTEAGIYPVFLVLNGDTSHIIRKNVAIGIDSMMMAGLTVSRIYSSKSISSSYGSTTTYNFPDTAISITIVDPATILFMKDSFTFNSFSGNILKFKSPYVKNYDPPFRISYKDLSFDLTTNKVHYEYDNLGAGHVAFQIYMDSK